MVERSLKLLHRLRNFGICGLDVAGLRHSYVGVPQDSLNCLIRDSELVKICR
jgi:hypothetical protein